MRGMKRPWKMPLRLETEKFFEIVIKRTTLVIGGRRADLSK